MDSKGLSLDDAMKKPSFKRVTVFVGRMKPLNQGTYKREFCKSERKPKETITVWPHEEKMFMF